MASTYIVEGTEKDGFRAEVRDGAKVTKKLGTFDTIEEASAAARDAAGPNRAIQVLDLTPNRKADATPTLAERVSIGGGEGPTAG